MARAGQGGGQKMAITNLEEVIEVLNVPKRKYESVQKLIPLVEDAYLSIRNKPFDTDENGNVIYPTGASLVAIEMISFHLQTGNKAGVASESLGDHSISFVTGEGPYPASITGKIKRFAKFT